MLKKLLDKTKGQVAYSFLTVKAVTDNAEFVTITGIATTPTPDRVGDIVEPLGVKFNNPMPLLWQHDRYSPVGTVEFDKPTKKGVTFTAKIPLNVTSANLKARVDEAVESVRLGLVRAVSIGFRPLEYSWMDEGGVRFLECEVYELSLVTIPAQAEATIDSVKAIVKGYMPAALGQKHVTVKTGDSVKSITRNPVILTKTKEPSQMEALKKKIEDFLAAKSLKASEQEALVEKSDGSTLDGDSAEKFDSLEEEIAAIDEHVKRLETMVKRMEFSASTAKPVNKGLTVSSGSISRASPIAATAKAPVGEKGTQFARWVMCLATAKGNLMQAQQIAQTRFQEDEALNVAMKAAVAAGTTTDATWAAPLVDSYQRFAGDFVEFLRPQTILGKFGTNGVPSLFRVPFNISIPGQTSGGDGYWVGEGAAKPVTKFDFNAINLRWAKVANIAVLTEELVRFSNPSAEVLVRNALAAALIARLDTDFVALGKAAVSNVSPASITNGVTGIASSGNDAAAVRQDVIALFTAYITANMTPINGVWIMSSVNALALSLMTNALGQKEFPGITMLGGTFEGLPVITSEYTPAGVVILANASDIYLADDGQVVVDASTEASLQMDTAPANATGAGSAAVSTVSMFQTNSVAIRAERWINWQKRRAQAVQLLTGVAWGQPDA